MRLSREIASLERIAGELRRIERLRSLDACLEAPGPDGTRETYVARAGRVTVHATTPTREAGQTAVCPERIPGVIEADHLDELIVFASFLDAPPPELPGYAVSGASTDSSCTPRRSPTNATTAAAAMIPAIA